MSDGYVLSIDQGTTSTKAVVVAPDGIVVARHVVQVGRDFPRTGWVEQDARELWQSVTTAAADALQQSPATPTTLAVAAQRESVLLWDRTSGEPLTPCVSWQCQRGASRCAALTELGVGRRVQELTGLPLDPSFTALKLWWLLESDPRLRDAAERGAACAGTIDSWLAWNLTGGALHVTDAGNASRTQLLDIHRLEWAPELLELFEVPVACLPAVIPTIGVLDHEVSVGELQGLPIGALAADSHAALYGHGCTTQGSAKATFGTGTSLMATTRHASEGEHELTVTVAWSRPEATYALEGNILSSGSTVQWVADLLGLALGAKELAELALEAPHGQVTLVPAFAGLAAPYWNPQARGRIDGLAFSTGRAALARAAVDSIAFQVADLVRAADRELEVALAELHVDGGGSTNDDLVQFQADLLGRPVLRSSSPDVTAIGAAYLAGVAAGVWADDEEIRALDRRVDRFEPVLESGEREQLLAGWHAALEGLVDHQGRHPAGQLIGGKGPLR